MPSFSSQIRRGTRESLSEWGRNAADRASYSEILEQYGCVVSDNGAVENHKKITYVSGGKKVEVKIIGVNKGTGVVRCQFYLNSEQFFPKGLATGFSDKELCPIHSLRTFLENKNATIG
ncbi:MAG TPA: hypothetical protein DEB09_03405 [Candidatus Magasanikbacteria bacterium]|nr:hypothetical protein [Candidatus Magasanikbacteria bacterium]